MIIAEIGSVHDGSFGNAKKLISIAKESGANAVKFQMHIADEESTKDAPSPSYFKSEKRYSYFQRTAFSILEWRKLISFTNKLRMIFICSPFSIKALSILIEDLNVNHIKIASGEINNIPLIESLLKYKKQNLKIYLSSGMSTLSELKKTFSILKKFDPIVMQCTSMYPCDAKNVGINNIDIFKKTFKCRIGFSDHTQGYAASISAIMKGAEVIEKHITFSKKMYGSDAKFAMEPNEFKVFSDEINFTLEMLKNPIDKNNLNKNLNSMRKTFNKSIYANKELKKNDTIKFEDLSFKKPSVGIPASEYKNVIGKKIKKNISKNQNIKFNDIF